jgi:protein YibB
MITIVTAFFDIGRGDWTPDKGLPHYLVRTTDTYFERFGHMAKLDNPMVIFTSEDLSERVLELRQGKPTQIITLDFENNYTQLRNAISEIQQSDSFKSIINPEQIRNPEYWNADYVLVNLLKSHFVCQALPYVDTELVAWLDFGYCRDESTRCGVTQWTYPFDPEKIHFFNIKDFQEGTYIQDIIANNDVHITGPFIVGSKKTWPILRHIVEHNTMELLKNGLIDDDQTILLMSYLQTPELFELHQVPVGDWFVAFKHFTAIVV